MARVKRGPKRAAKRKKILKLSSGFFGTKGAHRMAKQAADRHSDIYVDRRKKARFRRLWILRINAAARLHGAYPSDRGPEGRGQRARSQDAGRSRGA